MGRNFYHLSQAMIDPPHPSSDYSRRQKENRCWECLHIIIHFVDGICSFSDKYAVNLNLKGLYTVPSMYLFIQGTDEMIYVYSSVRI